MNPRTVVQMMDVSMGFGPIQAVDHVSLTVQEGEVFGFLGPNGAGKTTTIRLLLGLLPPTTGRAEVLGFDTGTQAQSIREHCGALLEFNGLYERLSARDNLEFQGRAWRMPAAQREARIEEMLTDIGLWERRLDLVGTWSRGMKQKLAVARAMFHRPELIFLDEPTAGLDPVAAAALRQDLVGLAEREGVTIFLTTHNLAEAEKLCHRVGVIRKGRLLAVGTVDELSGRNGSIHAEIAGKGFNDAIVGMLRAMPDVGSVRWENSHVSLQLERGTGVAPLVKMLVGCGVQIEGVHKDEASLEDVFLDLMQEEKEGAR
jgi:ABC-2 type transport system ATP-binding protein